jgi:radical SAM superfamily enzyme YgiQ (UPF0313 family)
VLVVDFANYINLERFKTITNLAIGKNTLFVGFCTTWFPYQLPTGEYSILEPSKPHNHPKESGDNSLPVIFGKYQTGPWFDHIRSINSKTKIILGGSKTYLYLTMQGVDNFFIGHAETMIIDYANSLSGKSSKRIFNKIIDYDKKAQDPKWDFRKSRIDYTHESFILSSETLLLEVGRGCRFNCKFCSYPLIGQKNIKDYLKFEECLYNELIENYQRWGVWKYTIVDDTFNDSTEKLEMVKRVVDRLPFKPAFWCYMRLDLIVSDNKQIQLAKDIGVREVYFGIETLNRTSGKIIGKGLDPERIKATLELCASSWGSNVWIETGLICGLPKDTVETFEKSCSYFNRSDRPVGHINVTPLRIIKYYEFTKYKFTAEFEANAEKYGYEFPYDNIPWKWIKQDGTDIDTFEKATELAIKWQKILDSHIKVNKCFFYISALSGDKFDYNNLMKCNTQLDVENQIGKSDIIELMRQQIEQEYFRPLLDFLSNASKSKKILSFQSNVSSGMV